ncbi:MAG: phytanoyl-CoA dioxygenase family protein [Phycisphaerales bacterium]|nr:phytanoyl-CoA dioxygenase family protein [Phycisphaerales bacterium]
MGFGSNPVESGITIDARANTQVISGYALLKPPTVDVKNRGHQDHAYFNVDTQDRLVGVWIALDQADVDNGCMQVLHAGALDRANDPLETPRLADL